jgi:hypothetical protein
MMRSRLSARRHKRVDLLQAGRPMNEVARTAAITPEQLTVLKSGEWFGALNSSFQQAVLASSRMIVLAAFESVFRRGDHVTAFIA